MKCLGMFSLISFIDFFLLLPQGYSSKERIKIETNKTQKRGEKKMWVSGYI